MSDLAQRVQKLERRSRKLQVRLVAVLAVLLSVPLVGAVMPQEIPDVIEARQFRVASEAESLPFDIQFPNEDKSRFGSSMVATKRTLVVGAPDDPDPIPRTGAAHVYSVSKRGFKHVAKLVPSDPGVWGDPTRGPGFGRSVAVHRTTIVVGAPEDRQGGGKDAGAVYVFEKRDGDWIETAKLLPSEPQARSWFGQSVAIYGNRIAVGAAGWHSVGERVGGAAYLFERRQGAWIETVRLEGNPRPLNLSPGEWFSNYYFGWAVALSKDTLAVGDQRGTAASASGIPHHCGTVRVYRNAGGNWPHDAIFYGADSAWARSCPPNLQFHREFPGLRLAIQKDRIVLGNQYHAHGPRKEGGAVYVFDRVDGSWIQSHELTDGSYPFKIGLGASVAIDKWGVVAGASGKFGADTYLYDHDGQLLSTRDEPGFGVESVALTKHWVVAGGSGNVHAARR